MDDAAIIAVRFLSSCIEEYEKRRHKQLVLDDVHSAHWKGAPNHLGSSPLQLFYSMYSLGKVYLIAIHSSFWDQQSANSVGDSLLPRK